ncbi:MAG: hypothetical protein MJE77_44450 [Proteobacteria bacterium]|nr:hypothetical protein [Pseudomonadota bacterium]
MTAHKNSPPDGNQNDTRKEPALKTFWRYPYASLMKERKPPGWEVKVEEVLSLAPRSADQLLLYRDSTERRDHEAKVMRGLWPLLTDVAILEFKGPTRGLRQRDLMKLLSYGTEYLSLGECPIQKPSELSLVLVVPKETPTLRREYERCEVEPEQLEGGYVRLDGCRYTLVVALLDKVADADRDDFLRLFTDDRGKVKDSKSLQWIQAWIRKASTMEELKDTEEYRDVVKGLLETVGVEGLLNLVDPNEILSHYDPEQRLAGLDPDELLRHVTPEQRLTGLDPEQRLAGLDPEQLRLLRAALDKKLNGS